MMKKEIVLLWIIYLIFCIIPICYVSNISPDAAPESSAVPASDFLCDFNSSTKVSSSKSDVVLLFATNHAIGLELCIKSLRSTGAECQIVLFCAPQFTFTRNLMNLFHNLRVEIVTNCVEKKKREYVPHMLRFEFELDWLLAHRDTVKRVIHTDSFDVFFQGDPFHNLDADSITFVVEPHQIRSCGWNLAWIRECYKDKVMNSMAHRFIICSGSIGGNSELYIKLLQLMIRQPEWDSCYEPSKDQPILNYLVWTGLVDREGIKYKLTGCDAGFFTVQWCIIEKTPYFNEHGQLISTMKTVPSYIHQYNRLIPLQNYFFRLCKLTY